jgi:hypothetical protein
MTDRIDPPALAGRMPSAAVSGRTVAGTPGAALAGGISLAAAAASWRVRKELAAKVPDPALGAAEDALAFSLAWFATRAPHPEPAVEPALAPLDAAARGLVAGAAGTAVMTLAQLLALTDSSDAPERAGRKLTPPWEQSPQALLTDAGLHLLYGLTAATTFKGLIR